MAETPFSDEDSGPSIQLFSPSIIIEEDASEQIHHFKTIFQQQQQHQEQKKEILVPSEQIEEGKEKTYHPLTDAAEHQISASLDQLSTSSDSDEHFRKRVRVGNHYQARIPKYFGNFTKDNISYATDFEDKQLWDPLGVQPEIVETFLKKLSSITKLIIPMGNHLRDNEQALYVLQEHNYNIENALKAITTSTNSSSSFISSNNETMSVWTAEECKNFELGLVRFGKNFFSIQKRKVSTRKVGELVQFYYLWKKTERYDLFAHRIRAGKKKYCLNPGISDLMNKYLKGQNQTIGTNLGPQDVQFLLTDNKDETQEADMQY